MCFRYLADRLTRGLAIVLAVVMLLPLVSAHSAQTEPPSDDNTLHRKNILKTIIVDNYYPYTFMNPDGLPDGLSVDLIRAVAKSMGLQVEIAMATWDDARRALAASDIDLLPMMTYSEQQAKDFDFSATHTTAHDTIFVKKGDTRIQSLDDLRGKHVIVMGKDAAYDFLLSTGISNPGNLVLTDSLPEALRQLALGKGDAALMPKLAGLLLLNNLGLSNLEALPAVVEGYQRAFSIAVKKGDKTLLDHLSEGLSIVEATGEYAKIHRKWFGLVEPAAMPFPAVMKYVLFAASFIVLIAIVIGLWSLSLRKLVALRTSTLAQEVEERKRAEEEIKRNESRLRRLVSILQHPSETIQDFLDYALEQAIQLTESKLGYIYHYHEDRKEFVLNTWSKEVMAECAVAKPPTFYELDKTGIWGEAVRQRRPIIVNDFLAAHPLKKGCPDGHVQLLKFMTVPIFKNEGIVGVVGVANKETDYDETDILQCSLLMEAVWKDTERKLAEKALRESEERLREVLENSVGASYKLNLQTNTYDYLSPVFALISGYTPDEMKTLPVETVLSLKHPDDLAEIQRVIAESICGAIGTACEVAYRFKNKEGDYRWLRDRFTVMRDMSGQPLALIGSVNDITARKEAEAKIQLLNAELEQLALTDFLTNLYNRRYFMQRGAEELKRATRNSQPLALLMLDIDEFKKVNDTCGHEAGDLTLQQVAAALKSSLRETDIIGRLGGEEFAVLLPNTSPEGAVLLAERVRQSIANTSFEMSPGEPLISIITISVGVATFTDEISGIDDLLRNADAALYRAKNSGRNCVGVYQKHHDVPHVLPSACDDNGRNAAGK
jgi:diguanylate cyclase (GGDEF)-like protein/PAS domain S-box-containing protein